MRRSANSGYVEVFAPSICSSASAWKVPLWAAIFAPLRSANDLALLMSTFVVSPQEENAKRVAAAITTARMIASVLFMVIFSFQKNYKIKHRSEMLRCFQNKRSKTYFISLTDSSPLSRQSQRCFRYAQQKTFRKVFHFGGKTFHTASQVPSLDRATHCFRASIKLCWNYTTASAACQ